MPEERTYLIRCTYRPGGAQDRLAIRREHIEHMLEWLPRTVLGGALLDSAGKEPVGMVVALRCEAEDVDRFIATEPYCRAGLFDAITVDPLIQMTPPYTRAVLERELGRCS